MVAGGDRGAAAGDLTNASPGREIDAMNEQHHVLVVDDEEQNQIVLEMMLRSFGYVSKSARNGMEALTSLSAETDLVLMDVMMPQMDGYETTRRIRQIEKFRDIPIIIVTALSGRVEQLKAVEAGANDFIVKPIDLGELQIRTASMLKMKGAQDAVKRYQADLEQKVEERTADLQQALTRVAALQRNTYESHLDTVRRLAVAAEYKDRDTAFHVQRVSQYCATLGRVIGLSSADVEMLLHASMMHDAGKIGIPDAILLKTAKLDAEEWELMKKHTTIGGRILGGSDSPLLQAGETIALSHHEKWDGTGYPNGLRGEDIPLWGRICAVADVFDAITVKRPYKPALPVAFACETIRDGTGKHFDPQLAEAFLSHLEEILCIKNSYAEVGTA